MEEEVPKIRRGFRPEKDGGRQIKTERGKVVVYRGAWGDDELPAYALMFFRDEHGDTPTVEFALGEDAAHALVTLLLGAFDGFPGCGFWMAG